MTLNNDGGAALPQEATSMDPSSYAALDDHQPLGQHTVTFLFQKEILGIFQENFSLTQLVISLTQDSGADSVRCLLAVNLVNAKQIVTYGQAADICC